MGIAHVGEADEDIADTIHALGPMEFATLFGASALRRCINRTKEALWAGVTKRPTIIAKTYSGSEYCTEWGRLCPDLGAPSKLGEL